MIAALRTFYAVYHPHGLEMVSIHTATDDVDAVRRFADEYRIDYPIAVDAEGKDGGVRPSGAETARSGAEGRYVLKSLRRGGYTLEVTAPGFNTAVLAAIPSGTLDADTTLARPGPGSSEKR